MSSNSSGGMSATGFFMSLVTVAFIVLKLTGYIDWSWPVVLLPLWLPIALVVAVVIATVVVASIISGVNYLLDKFGI